MGQVFIVKGKSSQRSVKCMELSGRLSITMLHAVCSPKQMVAKELQNGMIDYFSKACTRLIWECVFHIRLIVYFNLSILVS